MKTKKKKVIMSWSSGKDSAWALYQLQQDPSIEILGLCCTVNQQFQRVAMHGVRLALVKKQAQALSLPIDIIALPHPCSNDDYQRIMGEYISTLKQRKIDAMAFGDLFLEDIRKYRENMLNGTGISPIFPLWGMNTKKLFANLFHAGVRAITTCVDTNKLSEAHLGKILTPELIETLAKDIDPCGENGEFHTFVFYAPNFKVPISVSLGERVKSNEFVFIDLEQSSNQ